MAGMVPDLYLYVTIAVSGFIIIFFIMRELSLRKSGDIGYIYAKAQLDNKPVLELLETSTMSIKPILGEYDEKGKPFWDIDLNTHYMKPDFSAGRCKPAYYKNVPIYSYSTIRTNPLDRETMMALNTLSDHRDDDEILEANNVIKHISDRDLFSLFRSPLKDLKKDCVLFLPDDILHENTGLREARLIEIYDAVREVKKYLYKQKVELGFYSKVLAFETNPFSKSAQDTERIISAVKAEEMDKWLNQERKTSMVMIFGIVAAGVICATGLAVYIISTVV